MVFTFIMDDHNSTPNQTRLCDMGWTDLSIRIRMHDNALLEIRFYVSLQQRGDLWSNKIVFFKQYKLNKYSNKTWYAIRKIENKLIDNYVTKIKNTSKLRTYSLKLYFNQKHRSKKSRPTSGWTISSREADQIVSTSLVPEMGAWCTYSFFGKAGNALPMDDWHCCSQSGMSSQIQDRQTYALFGNVI